MGINKVFSLSILWVFIAVFMAGLVLGRLLSDHKYTKLLDACEQQLPIGHPCRMVAIPNGYCCSQQ